MRIYLATTWTAASCCGCLSFTPALLRYRPCNFGHSYLVGHLQATGSSLGTSSDDSFDVVLSSGHCAFAAHCGFLEAIERSWGKQRVDAVVGTSSGALAGALWAAGLSAEEVAKLLGDESALSVVRRPCWRPWQGLLSLNGLVELLREYLPPTFEELLVPLAVGVVGSDRTPELLSSGPLPEAVAASMAIPFLFAPVEVDGTKYYDAGGQDRTGLSSWVSWRPEARALVHLVDSSHGAKGDAKSKVAGWENDPDVIIIRSPRSAASIHRGLGNFEGECFTAMKNALGILEPKLAKALPLIYPDELEPYLSLLEAGE